MLFKFKSKVTGDVIMLEPNGRRILEVIGKEPGPKGIIEPSQMPAAIAAINSAIEREEAATEGAKAKGEAAPKSDAISLRQRAVPFVDMLRRAQQANEAVTWGV